MTEYVLLIVVDALRRDKVGAYGGDLETPTMDSLAREGIVFDEAFACSNVTDVCVTSLLSGRYPLEHGILHHGEQVSDAERAYGAGVPTVPAVLSDEGYRTLAVEPVLERWHRRGFDEYRPTRPEAENGKNGTNQLDSLWERVSDLGSKFYYRLPKQIRFRLDRYLTDTPGSQYTASELTDIAIDLLSQPGESTFLFLHYWDVHTPYAPPSEYVDSIRSRKTYDTTSIKKYVNTHDLEGSITEQALYVNKLSDMVPGTIGEIEAHYDAAIEYLDDELGTLVRNLKREGIYDDTTILLTADHGESLGEHGIPFDHHGLYDQSIAVPLIISGGAVSGREDQISALVQQFDIAPTILDFFGEDPGACAGAAATSLRPFLDQRHRSDLGREYIFAEERHTQSRYAVRSRTHKLIESTETAEPCRYCDVVHADGPELYRLTDDPEERRNKLSGGVMNEASHFRDEFRDQYSSFASDLSNPVSSTPANYEEDRLHERLKHLGYR